MEPRNAPTVRAWKPPIPGVREVLHARFTDHAYPPHTHDAWTLFIVDDGVVRYDLGRHDRLAEPSMVSVLPPHVAHDGRPGAGRRIPEARHLPRAGGARRGGDRAVGRSAGRRSRRVCAARSRVCTTPSCAPTTRSTRRRGSHSSSSGSARRSGSTEPPTADPARARCRRRAPGVPRCAPVRPGHVSRGVDCDRLDTDRRPPAPSVRRSGSARMSTSPAGVSMRPARGSSRASHWRTSPPRSASTTRRT